jgi:hypothetical protein
MMSGMADNPYQAPQTRHDVTLPPAWRRHISLPLIILGVLAGVLLTTGLVRSILLLVELLQSPGMLMFHSDLMTFMIWCPVLAATAPGSFLSGLALRRIIRWTYVVTITIGLALTVSAYMLWWYSETKQVLAQHEQNAFGPLPSPFR